MVWWNLYLCAKGVKVDIPLQTYFRINNENTGQFERTLIIVDEGSNVHYVEGCTAPTYSSNSLHAAIVEIFALDGAYMRYTTIQNWSDNVYNLVTKRAKALKDATVEWIDGNLGAKTTMKYPSVYLDGEGGAWNHALYRLCQCWSTPRYGCQDDPQRSTHKLLYRV